MPTKKGPKYPVAIDRATAKERGVCFSCEGTGHLAPTSASCTNHDSTRNDFLQEGMEEWGHLGYKRLLTDEVAQRDGMCWACKGRDHMYPWSIKCPFHKKPNSESEPASAPDPVDESDDGAHISPSKS